MHMLVKLENDRVNTEKKLGRGFPIHNDFSFTPSPFPSQHKVCVCGGGGGGGGGGEDRSGWGTCTTLNY